MLTVYFVFLLHMLTKLTLGGVITAGKPNPFGGVITTGKPNQFGGVITAGKPN